MKNIACDLWWDGTHASNEGEGFSIAILTISFSIFSVLWFLWNAKQSKNSNPPLPPGPRGVPVVGYLPFLGAQLHKEFSELVGVYGPVYKLWLGTKLCVVVSSPSLAKEIVRDKDVIFANRDPPTVGRVSSYGGNDIVWSSYGPAWKKMRKLFVSELMSNATLDAFNALRKKVVRKTIRDLCDKMGKPIELGEVAFITSLNAIMSMLWGGTLEDEEAINAGNEFRKMVDELVILVGKPNVSDFFPLLSRLDLQGLERKTKKIVMGIEEFLNYAIKKGSSLACANRECAGQSKDFLQLLLELQENGDPATSITMTQLKGMLLDIVVGGTDTTSTMVEWTIAELIKHQDKMKMVHQELDEVVGSDVVEESHLPKLRYLDAVVKETFRLHPAVPFLVPRSPSTSSTLGGYTIPKGSTIFLNVYAIQRDPQIWKNPLEFQPERFMDAETSKLDFSGNDFQFLPFGSGRRLCPGLPMAKRMLMFQVASLLHSFEWKVPDDTELELSDKYGIVLKKMKPLVVIPTPRLYIRSFDHYFDI